MEEEVLPGGLDAGDVIMLPGTGHETLVKAVCLARADSGTFDGAQAGRYPPLAGGDGPAVLSTEGALGKGLAVLLDLADMSFALVGMGRNSEDGSVGGGIEDQGDRLAFGVPVF